MQITDLLVEATREAVEGNFSERTWGQIEGPHVSMLETLEGRGVDVKEARETVKELLQSCRELLQGSIGREERRGEGTGKSHVCAPKGVSTVNRRTRGGVIHESARDAILAFGERLSAPIAAAALGCKTRETLVRTDEGHAGNNNVDFDATREACEAAHLADERLIVLPGFIGFTPRGRWCTLGRSGSDYTATIYASVLRARRCVIWTDVTGVFSADPRHVPDAYMIPRITFREASEMAFFGSKVLFSRCVHPCEKLNIPIEVRKTAPDGLDPAAPMTIIGHESVLRAAVSAIQHVSVIVVSGSGMKGRAGTAATVFEALKDANASALMIAQASSEQEVCFVVESEYEEGTVRALNQRFRNEIALGIVDEIVSKSGLSIVNVVLGKPYQTPGVVGKLFSAAGAHKINIVAIAQPASEMSVSCVVSRSEVRACMQAFHAAFMPRKRRINVVLLGASGNVGKAVHKLIQDLVVCACTSKTITFVDTGEVVPMSLDVLLQRIAHLDRLHVVDCTASAEVTACYPRFLALPGAVLVTANKQGNSGAQPLYDQLVPHIRTHRFRFEATVMAGVPVICTIQNLVRVGDKIHWVAGVFSGTLSYIFNSMHHRGVKFSEAVREAKALGYTEPDPRDDLSGLDVQRKAVVLGRLIGVPNCSLEGVEWTSPRLVSPALAAMSLDDFMSKGLQKMDEEMELRTEHGAKRLLFVARVTAAAGCSCGLEVIEGPNNPFASVSGANNLMVICSDVYPAASPLVIFGPGAGAANTAVGILSDLHSTTRDAE